jgi:pyruvate-ferredoxin/flavodoxin oxidoreductase
MQSKWLTLEGNEAAVRIAYKLSEVIAIYPITPSTPMGEYADAWSTAHQPNLWGSVPQVIEMQSEGGAAGAIHGAIQTGALSTTFTASQGLLLMIPNMYKIAGELTPTVFHVAARSLAAQGLSIFGDHSDVMATRATGFAMLASSSVQEAQDLALIAHASTLKSRLPFIHFFDGFRTSHEINKIEPLGDTEIQKMIDEDLIQAHRNRALSPDHPFIRGTAQNPDVYFQARESVNAYYAACPNIVQQMMYKFGAITKRNYHLFDYTGKPNAEKVIVIMGSGAETAQETVRYLNKHGEKVGVVNVHLFRPFSVEHFLKALPPTVKKLAVLDRTKEPGSAGEPLYLDILTAVSEKNLNLKVIGGRYGLSSKEFTPGMVKAIFEELNQAEPKNHFTIGINDDVTNTSLDYETDFSIEDSHTVKCVFWGLGSDGTVGANKNSIKIIGEETSNHAQGYFVYDSKKSGSVTISHLRFGPHPIRAPYLISQANFTACHQFGFLERLDVLKYAAPGGNFLLNSPYSAGEVWDYLPYEVQKILIEKNLRFYVINAEKVAKDTGMGGRINSVMQTAFFALSGVLPRERAIHKIKESIKKSYGKRGAKVVEQNYQAVDQTLAELYEVPVPAEASSNIHRRPIVPAEAPEFVQKVLAPMLSGEGDALPVSFMPDDGTYPSGTSKWERRSISPEIPAWDSDLCIQCGKCVMVCPHAVIRHKVYDPALLETAPTDFISTTARFKEFGDKQYTLQVAPEDCTGCALCVEVCPVKDKLQIGRKALNMVAKAPLLAQEKMNWDFFLNLPEADRTKFSFGTIKNSQLLIPLFEFSGACAGCGETPYIKLVTQLFGDRAIIANATGCSSIFGGNLPTTPWTQNRDGRGPAWSNSLFEDNAEFGLGMRVTLDKQLAYAKELLPTFSNEVGEALVTALLEADQSSESGIQSQRARVQILKERLPGLDLPHAKDLLNLADVLVKRSVWLIGGDGWAYDIGYGGLDHVLASGRNVNVLVLDTEVYSNTGGQASKATPRGAMAKFAFGGKTLPKKDLGLLAMTYGYIYVARVAMGANDQQTLNAFLEAEAYNGPSLIIAYSHCIAHGIDMRKGLDQQKRAVQSGLWNLFRYNPTLENEGKNPLILDSKEPNLAVEEYISHETRYQTLMQSHPEQAEQWLNQIKQDAQTQRRRYLQMQQLIQPPEEVKL